MSTYSKPLPVADPDSAPFWTACVKHELRAQQCTNCDQWRWPPRGYCPRCHSADAEWRRLDGTGIIESYVVVHRAFNPGFAEDIPLVIVEVRLDGTEDQVVLTSNLAGLRWEEVKVGIPVAVFFDDVTPEVTLPKFKPRTV